jgi:hypothetical protein
MNDTNIIHISYSHYRYLMDTSYDTMQISDRYII